MKNGIFVNIFTPVAAAAGGLLQAFRVLGVAEPGGTADIFGVSLLACAAGGGLLMMRMRRTDSQRFARALAGSEEAGLSNPIDWPEDHLSPVVAAVNGTLSRAGELVEESETESRRLAVELKISASARQHAEAVIGSIEDAVIVTDPFDEVVLVNQSAVDLFGVNTDVTRQPVEKVVHADELVQCIRQTRQGNSQVRRVSETTLSVSGRERDFRLTQICVSDSSSRSEKGERGVGVVTVLRDTTRVTQMQQAKNEFVSGVTHELRTPIASIKAYAEMLADGDVADEKGRDEFYEIILNEADRLSNLIDNILNISRIESGLVEIDRKPTSPVLIAEKALGVIEPQAKLKNITVHRQLLPSMYQVTADEDLLYQVMLNLLSNAVKYTPDGGSVTLAIEADESGGRIATRVVDTGAGIPAEDLPRVFEKFYRVKQNNALAKGTGLGLPLVKRVIEEDHDGQLIAESEPGKGSTFGFYLPMAGKSSVEATEETDMTQQGQSRVEVSPSDSGSVSKEAA